MLKEAHQCRKDIVILELQHSIKNLATQVRQLMSQPKGGEREPPMEPPYGSYPSQESQYGHSSSNEERRPRRKRTHEDDLRNLKIKAPKLDDSLKPENYLEWVQAIERIVEIKGYSGEKSFKITV